MIFSFLMLSAKILFFYILLLSYLLQIISARTYFFCSSHGLVLAIA